MWSAKVGTFPADRRSREAYLNATFTQQSPRLAIIAFKVRRRDAGFFFFFWVGFQCLQTVRCRGGAECLQVSGSSRQDLPAVGCLIGTPPVCFFCFPSAAALIVLAQRSLSHRGVELASSRLSPCSVSAATSCFKCVRAKRVSAPLKPHRCSQTDAITLERR